MTSPSVPPAVQAWHRVASSLDPALLDPLVADNAVFCSPAVHRPQEGKAVTIAYLSAALVVLGPSLRYRHQWCEEHSAVLEFEADLDGTYVQGVDMLRWDEHDKITEFTVIVRPLRGLEALIKQMRAQLEA